MPANPYENLNAYGQTQKASFAPQDSSREIDAHALLVCASRLDEAKRMLGENPKSRDLMKKYGDEIRRNQRLWTIFQVAMSDPDNPLPEGIKILILKLGRYIDKTSFKAVGRYTPDLIDSLTRINRTIAAGLNRKPPMQAQPTQAQRTNDAVPETHVSISTSV